MLAFSSENGPLSMAQTVLSSADCIGVVLRAIDVEAVLAQETMALAVGGRQTNKHLHGQAVQDSSSVVRIRRRRR
jgi:hypothetical protein